ncbi:MAG: DUF4430 domain-containing protein [Atopobiaceae bacterium]|nr:DUF4430 domain-containing protein [Atopobiaceae bacterium]
MSSPVKKVTRLFVAIVLAGGLAVGGCASNQAAPAAEQPKEVVQIAVVGPDGAGKDVAYLPQTEYALADVADAWTLSQKAFDAAKLTYDAANSDYGVMLNSINSPIDNSVLAWDEASGKYWQLFVDGKASEVGIDGVELADGTSIVWYYSAFGDALPDVAALPAVEALDAAA